MLFRSPNLFTSNLVELLIRTCGFAAGFIACSGKSAVPTYMLSLLLNRKPDATPKPQKHGLVYSVLREQNCQSALHPSLLKTLSPMVLGRIPRKKTTITILLIHGKPAQCRRVSVVELVEMVEEVEVVPVAWPKEPWEQQLIKGCTSQPKPTGAEQGIDKRRGCRDWIII